MPADRRRPPPVMELREVTKSFGAIQALTAVDMSVRAGEILGLLGDNGAGKSTLIKIMSGVFKPDAGELRWHGDPLSMASPADARALGIETVFQHLALVDEMSIARNVFLAKELCRRVGPIHVMQHKRMERATALLLDEIGISSVRSPAQKVRSLSGGERQAIAIGRTMHFGAKMIILDEPTSALAVGETAKVLRYVQQVRAAGVAVVVISHNLYDVHPIADRLIVLEHGQKVVDATPSEISIDELAHRMTFHADRDVGAPIAQGR
jgi:simple sugar transport system ATP-binding protein